MEDIRRREVGMDQDGDAEAAEGRSPQLFGKDDVEIVDGPSERAAP